MIATIVNSIKSQLADMRELAIKNVKSAVYIGCLTQRYGPLVTSVCYSLSCRLVDQCLPRVCWTQISKGRLTIPKPTPIQRNQIGNGTANHLIHLEFIAYRMKTAIMKKPRTGRNITLNLPSRSIASFSIEMLLSPDWRTFR